MLGNNNYKIIDNFLDRVQLHDLKNFIYSEQLPWYHRRNDTNLDTSKNRNGFFSFCFYNEGRPDHKAFDELLSAIELDSSISSRPYNHPLYHGLVHETKDEFEEALKIYDDLIKKEPDFALAHGRIGLCHYYLR